MSAVPTAAQPAMSRAADVMLAPAVWQGPEISAPTAAQNAVLDDDAMHSVMNPLRVALQPTPPIPPQSVQVSPNSQTTPNQTQTIVAPSKPATGEVVQPLLDGNSPTE